MTLHEESFPKRAILTETWGQFLGIGVVRNELEPSSQMLTVRVLGCLKILHSVK